LARPTFHLIAGPNGASKTTRPPRLLLSFVAGSRVKSAARLPAWAGALYGQD
jgi:hypothetical protein